MQTVEQSCLVSRLSRFVDLDRGECEFIAQMERDERSYAKGRAIAALGGRTDSISVLKTGWAVVRSEDQTGSGQILRVYIPGEVIGLAELGAREAHHRIVMQTDGVVCPFPRDRLSTLLTDFPRLAALLISIGSLDQIALRHHATALGSMKASARFKFFLLQLRARLEVANVGLGNRIQVPFSQAELGQILGLTPVYINKLLNNFRKNGELEVERPYFRLLAREEWEQELGFRDPYLSMDTTWFPQPGASGG
ncbi:Crp/Fnr family transcriptional regulator [Paracoccus sp. TK19116]|uniref:Crp/Fnr family transcriptional regulator n=2 Tax=Paracoccus albicereus TaxID=2922394 RepID=A0ABT1MN38_9RHOB|nr:Crp/Fnr family transcriptional regulator [Paracoccus albicereus]